MHAASQTLQQSTSAAAASATADSSTVQVLLLLPSVCFSVLIAAVAMFRQNDQTHILTES